MHQGDYELVYQFVFAGLIVNKSMLNVSKASESLLIGRLICLSMLYRQIYAKCIKGVRLFLIISLLNPFSRFNVA